MYDHIKKQDLLIYKSIKHEGIRQTEGLELIPSENYTSSAVMEAMGSHLTNKYSEGYAGKRYYNGNEYIDEIERMAIERAKKLFGVEHVNVQPYSGSPANLTVYLATCRPGDVVLGLNLPDGGHLTHGWKVSATGIFYKTLPYHVRKDGRIDIDEVRRLAKEHKPKLIWAGATAYEFKYDYAQFADIADEVGAYLAVDIAHIAGLVIAGVHPDPVPHAHIVTTTTHKTLRGPHGGLIMTNDPALAKRIDQAVFPGSQGGPLVNMIAAKAVAFGEAQHPNFAVYAKRTLDNAKVMATVFAGEGIRLITGGTSNHLILADVWGSLGITGQEAETVLDEVGITLNKNVIADDERRPLDPSGIRFGTPAITTRGFGERECSQVAQLMVDVMRDRSEARRAAVRSEIQMLCERFPIPDSFV